MSDKETIIGVLVSGSGSNFRAIDDAIRGGRLENASVGVVLSDNPNAGGLKIAEKRGIPNMYLGDVTSVERNECIAEAFHDHKVDFGIAAGYLKFLGGSALRYEIMNIHPGPLPSFGGKGMYGRNVHEAVIAAGVKWSGPTVHLVDEIYDHGQILAHRQVPVLENDTWQELASRVLVQEHDLYWRVIAQQIARGSHPQND